MGITVRLGTEADATVMAEIATAAFSPERDGIARALFPEHLQKERNDSWSQEFADFNLKRKSKRVNESSFILTVAVDEQDNRVVGYATWVKPTPAADDSNDGPPMREMPGMDPEALKRLVNIMGSSEEKIDKQVGGANKVWHLDSIGVLPSQQRRGIGMKLLNWGLTEVVDPGQDCYLIATPAGLPLYTAAGFKPSFSIEVFDETHVVMGMSARRKSLE